MIYLETGSSSPYYNLAFEEYVFEKLNVAKEYFMLWQNDRTVVVGRYQNTTEEVNAQYVDEVGIHVVRRLSGGGAVYHDMGNLNYTFIVNQDKAPDFDFKIFTRPVISVLNELGVEAEFAGRNDIVIQGKKCSGNSQYCKNGRILHHGTILLNSDLSMIERALPVNRQKIESKSVKSVRSRVTNVADFLDQALSMDELKHRLIACVAKDTWLEAGHISEADNRSIRELQSNKYQTWEWNYGSSLPYPIQKSKKFPAGLVSVRLQAEGNRIAAIHFSGDFFGNGDISLLEQALVGTPLNEELYQKLVRLRAEEYMKGISPGDIYEMLI